MAAGTETDTGAVHRIGFCDRHYREHLARGGDAERWKRNLSLRICERKGCPAIAVWLEQSFMKFLAITKKRGNAVDALWKDHVLTIHHEFQGKNLACGFCAASMEHEVHMPPFPVHDDRQKRIIGLDEMKAMDIPAQRARDAGKEPV